MQIQLTFGTRNTKKCETSKDVVDPEVNMLVLGSFARRSPLLSRIIFLFFSAADRSSAVHYLRDLELEVRAFRELAGLQTHRGRRRRRVVHEDPFRSDLAGSAMRATRWSFVFDLSTASTYWPAKQRLLVCPAKPRCPACALSPPGARATRGQGVMKITQKTLKGFEHEPKRHPKSSKRISAATRTPAAVN